MAAGQAPAPAFRCAQLGVRAHPNQLLTIAMFVSLQYLEELEEQQKASGASSLPGKKPLTPAEQAAAGGAGWSDGCSKR